MTSPLPGPYTTITVKSYHELTETLHHLRHTIQRAREALEQGFPDEAKRILATAG